LKYSHQNILKVFKQQIYKMSSNTDTNTVRSICIPRVFDNIGEARIRDIFEKLDIFEIARIDVIQKQGIKGDKFKRVFIHIKTWSGRSDALKARDRLLAGKDLKIVYDDPWFWKVAVNKWEPKANPAHPAPKAKIRIEFDIDEDDEPTVQSKNAEVAARVLANVPRYEKEGNRRPTQHQEDRYRRPVQHSDDRYRRPDDRHQIPVQHSDDRYRRPEDRHQRPVQHSDDRYQNQRSANPKYNNRKPTTVYAAAAAAYDPVAQRDYRDGAYYEQQRQHAVALEASVPVSLEQEVVIQAATAETVSVSLEQETETMAATEPVIKSAATESVILEPILIKITPENVNRYIGEDITFKNGGEYVVRQILRASETGKTIEIDYPELKNNLQIVTRNVFLNNGAKMAAEPSKPRYIKVSDKKALNSILANALA
jgi:hypothetical protein